MCVGVGVLLTGAGLDDVAAAAAMGCSGANVNGAAEDGAEGDAVPPTLTPLNTSLRRSRTSSFVLLLLLFFNPR